MSDVFIRLHKDILWLILNKPPLNSLTVEMLDQLTTVLHNVLKQPPHLLVITGTGERAFCSGVELHDDSENHRTDLLRAAQDVSTTLEELHAKGVPSVAVVKGPAFGAGCELVALC